jgi:hypothetical protein
MRFKVAVGADTASIGVAIHPLAVWVEENSLFLRDTAAASGALSGPVVRNPAWISLHLSFSFGSCG